MKVYRVTTERDGETTRVPGHTSTELLQHSHYYGADSIEAVWEEIRWLRDDPEIEVLGVVEVLSALTVIAQATATTEGGTSLQPEAFEPNDKEPVLKERA